MPQQAIKYFHSSDMAGMLRVYEIETRAHVRARTPVANDHNALSNVSQAASAEKVKGTEMS